MRSYVILSLMMLLLVTAGCSLRTSTSVGNDASDTNPAGCDSVKASCDLPTSGPGGVRLCVEYGSATSTQALSDAETTCKSAQGAAWDTKPCTTSGQVAGCRLSNGLSCSTSWAYAPATKDIVEGECAPKGGTTIAR